MPHTPSRTPSRGLGCPLLENRSPATQSTTALSLGVQASSGALRHGTERRVTRVLAVPALRLRLPRLSSFRAFNQRSFVYLWLGSLVSNIGTWMEAIALGVYVTETTGRAE